MKTNLQFLKILGILLCGGLLYSCAANKAKMLEDKEQMLAAAGFTMKLADSPAKLAHLQQLAQQKITAYTKNGQTYFVYADAAECNCLYVGDNAAYTTFQRLQVEKNIADEQHLTADMVEDNNMNWGAWGPGPWGYYW